MSETDAKRLHIAVGVIYNADRDKVLLARRPLHADQGGLWEFPGGKSAQGEDISAALNRELFEELDLIVEEATPLLTIDHDYQDYAVRLYVWEVNRWRGQASGKEGQQIEWVPIRDLGKRRFPDANRSIVSAVKLPSLYAITPDLKEYGEDFFALARRLMRAGLRVLQFRSTVTRGRTRARIVERLVRTCGEFGCLLLLNDSPGAAVRSGAGGVHLNSARLLQLNERPLEFSRIVGASCHNRMELMQAAALKLDYALLGPVQETATHPEAVLLGWDRFEELARPAAIPVYALGGLHPEDAREARLRGARGIAMISGIWGAHAPEAAVRQCQYTVVNDS